MSTELACLQKAADSTVDMAAFAMMRSLSPVYPQSWPLLDYSSGRIRNIVVS